MAYTRQDHFYACSGHLKDKGFASPIVDAKEAAEKKKKEELDREIELIKKEHEEKMKRKSKNKKDKKEDGKENDEKGKKKEEDEEVKAEKEKDDKVSQRVRPKNGHTLTSKPNQRSKPSLTETQQTTRQLHQTIRLVYTLYTSMAVDCQIFT